MICAWCGNENARCDARGTCSQCGKTRDQQWRDMLEMANAGYMRQVIEANTLRKALEQIDAIPRSQSRGAMCLGFVSAKTIASDALKAVAS